MYTFTLTRKGCFIKVDKTNHEMIFDLDAIIKKYFVLHYINKTTKIRSSLKNYFTENGKVYFPRFQIEELIKKKKIQGTIINKMKKHDLSPPAKYLGKSNDNQTIVINHLMSNVFTKDNGVVLKMMAGSGKTYLAMDMISRLNQRTLIIVPNTYLLEQWVELIHTFFPDNKVG